MCEDLPRKWDVVIGENLHCQYDVTNAVDMYAVSVIKDGVVVGLVPKKISALFTIY